MDGLNGFADDLKEGFFYFLDGCKNFVVGAFNSVVSVLASLINIVAQALIGIVAGLGYLGGMIFGVSPSENDFSKWVETWRGGVNSFFEEVAPNDTVYNVTNSILDMAVSCIPIVGDIRDGVEVITGVNMITGEKLSLAERLITAACFFIPIVGASFVRESGQGIVKFIGKHWDEAMQFASKYIDEGITLLSKHGGDFLMNIAKKGDDLSTLLKRAFNFGDEIEFAGVGTLKGDPEVSTKLQDFVSKITGKVNNASSGTVKGVSKAESVLGKIDFSKLDNNGVKDLINNINKSTLSEEDKIIASIEIYNKAIESGIKVDIQVIASPKFIDSSGKIKWPEESGYTINPVTGKAIKYEVVPKKGDIIDRYGTPNGTFTSPIIDDISIPYEQRALPYLDNKNVYHQYEITRDFNELSEAIKNCKDKDLVELINADALRYGIDLDNLKTYGGEIAPAFDAIGGGTQWQLPLSVDYLIKLGFLKEIK